VVGAEEEKGLIVALRRLPDGSFWDPATGSVLPNRPSPAQLRANEALRAGQLKPIPSRGQQIEKVVQVMTDNGSRVLLQPRVESLAVDPYGTGMGLFPTMSDSMKKYLLTGAILAAAAGVVWCQSKMGSTGGKKK